MGTRDWRKLEHDADLKKFENLIRRVVGKKYTHVRKVNAPGTHGVVFGNQRRGEKKYREDYFIGIEKEIEFNMEHPWEFQFQKYINNNWETICKGANLLEVYKVFVVYILCI